MGLDINGNRLDIEWVQLIKEAKALGFKKKEIKHFLSECKKDSNFQCITKICKINLPDGIMNSDELEQS